MLSVVMPAFNEEGHIEEVLERASRSLSLMYERFEIVVVDDGSTDGTRERAVAAAARDPHIVVTGYESNHGKGQALRTGSSRASGDIVAFLDSDLDIHPEELETLLDAMDREGVDVVVGSKHHPLSRVRGYPSKRKLFSLCYYAAVKVLFSLPIRDTQTGVKVFRREVLDRVMPRVLVKQYAFDLETLAVAHHFGYAVSDAPVHIDFSRPFGRIRSRDAWLTLLDTLAIFYRIRIARYYDGPRPDVPLPEAEIYAGGVSAEMSAKLRSGARLA